MVDKLILKSPLTLVLAQDYRVNPMNLGDGEIMVSHPKPCSHYLWTERPMLIPGGSENDLKHQKFDGSKLRFSLCFTQNWESHGISYLVNTREPKPPNSPPFALGFASSPFGRHGLGTAGPPNRLPPWLPHGARSPEELFHDATGRWGRWTCQHGNMAKWAVWPKPLLVDG